MAFDSIRNIFRIPDLRRRILFTLAMFVVYRVGGHVPTPGINSGALAAAFAQSQSGGGLLGLYDLFVGGAFVKATVFALGIMPYISASIILQLMTAIVPHLERLQKEGEEGRRRITQYTRYGTVLLSMVQAYGIALFLESFGAGSGQPVVPAPGLGFRLLTMLTLTSGTIFVMWLGEQITDKGIGNGMSLIIFIGIVAQNPNDLINTWRSVGAGTLRPAALIFIAVLMLAITAATIIITQAMRRIPVQYAKRVVGRKVYGGQSTHIPLRVNTAGVIPIIFAQSILMFPGTLASFFPNSGIMQSVNAAFSPSSIPYNVFYAVLIVVFTFFYTAIVFNPVDLADNMKKYGGFIPGIRPGPKTSEYIDRILTRITLPGAGFLALMAIIPSFFIYKLNAPFYFGGTSLLIIVGVALDTLQQIESRMLMRHYEGFLKGTRLRGRRG